MVRVWRQTQLSRASCPCWRLQDLNEIRSGVVYCVTRSRRVSGLLLHLRCRIDCLLRALLCSWISTVHLLRCFAMRTALASLLCIVWVNSHGSGNETEPIVCRCRPFASSAPLCNCRVASSFWSYSCMVQSLCLQVTWSPCLRLDGWPDWRDVGDLAQNQSLDHASSSYHASFSPSMPD